MNWQAVMTIWGIMGIFIINFVIKYEQKYQNAQKWCIIRHTIFIVVLRHTNIKQLYNFNQPNNSNEF